MDESIFNQSVYFDANGDKVYPKPIATAGRIFRTVTNAREIQFALKFIF